MSSDARGTSTAFSLGKQTSLQDQNKRYLRLTTTFAIVSSSATERRTDSSLHTPVLLPCVRHVGQNTRAKKDKKNTATSYSETQSHQGGLNTVPLPQKTEEIQRNARVPIVFSLYLQD